MPEANPIQVNVDTDLFAKTDESAYILSTPARQMRIAFTTNNDIILAATYISMIGGATKQPGETTALYSKAHQIMQRVADQTGRSVRYVFGTRRPKLALWAASAGNKIVSWDRVDRIDGIDADDKTLLDPSKPFVAEKTYYPRQKSEYGD